MTTDTEEEREPEPGVEAPRASSRRSVLKYVSATAASAAVGLAAGAAAGQYACILSPPETITRIETVTRTVAETFTLVYMDSLRLAAEARGLLIGSLADEMSLNDERFRPTLTREFNSLTGSLGPIEGEDSDAIIKFASQNQMKVRGTALIWHGGIPDSLNSGMSVGAFRSAMEKYIREVVGLYRGRVFAWDVVNEAVDSDGLRKTVFLEKLGEGYVAEAFRLAHEADPDALLFYNDYDAEAAGGLQKAKSDRVYELVKKLVADGVPVHGVGLQMHLFAVEYPKPEDIAANVRRLAALGLKVAISEMDVRIKDLPLLMPERLEMQRRIYHDVIAACIREKGFVGITFWGFTDAHSWINEMGQGPDHPLLFDENCRPKPAYWGVMDALLGR